MSSTHQAHDVPSPGPLGAPTDADVATRNDSLEMVGLITAQTLHDVSNHLAAILAHVRVRQRDAHLDPQVRRSLEAIDQAASRCVDMALHVLKLARGVPLALSDVDLNQIVQEADCLLSAQCCDRRLLRTSLAEDLWSIRAVPGDVLRVVINLCVNAMHAMPEGGEISLTTDNRVLNTGVQAENSYVPPGCYARLTIADQGSGLHTEQRATLCLPSATTRPEGLGLGLASVRSVLERHDAHMSVHASSGQGTLVELLWPAAAGQRPAD